MQLNFTWADEGLVAQYALLLRREARFPFSVVISCWYILFPIKKEKKRRLCELAWFVLSSVVRGHKLFTINISVSTSLRLKHII